MGQRWPAWTGRKAFCSTESFVPPRWNFNRGVSTPPIKILDFRQGSFSSLPLTRRERAWAAARRTGRKFGLIGKGSRRRVIPAKVKGGSTKMAAASLLVCKWEKSGLLRRSSLIYVRNFGLYSSTLYACKGCVISFRVKFINVELLARKINEKLCTGFWIEERKRFSSHRRLRNINSTLFYYFFPPKLSCKHVASS